MIRDPDAYAWVSQRNALVDLLRKGRADLRVARALEIQRDTMTRLLVEEFRRTRATASILALLERCPVKGAAELTAWLRSGASPDSHDEPARSRWDKRVQRARAWARRRLPREWHRYLKPRRRPEPPSYRVAYMQACKEIP